MRKIVVGDLSGLPLPVDAKELLGMGEEFLTHAFRSFGSCSQDNTVTQILSAEAYLGGNSGSKLRLDVQFACSRPGNRTRLFVKFSRDLSDPHRDRRRYEMEDEIRFAALVRNGHLPVRVARPYFADFNASTGTGILITERVAFGLEGIEPIRRKCMDHQLHDPLEYYQCIVSALARLAGGHKSGALEQVDQFFPFDRSVAEAADSIPWTIDELRGWIAGYRLFVRDASNLMPCHLRSSSFIDTWEKEAVRLLAHERSIKAYINSDDCCIALCHWNAQLDNAWFWRNPEHVLECGLLDWGRVGQMNVACAIWGTLCGASTGIWDDHLEDLVCQFADEYHRCGGPLIRVDQLMSHLILWIATVGLAINMNAPQIICSRVPEARLGFGAADPIFEENEVARTVLQIFTVFLNIWQRYDIGDLMDQVSEWAEADAEGVRRPHSVVLRRRELPICG